MQAPESATMRNSQWLSPQRPPVGTAAHDRFPVRARRARCRCPSNPGLSQSSDRRPSLGHLQRDGLGVVSLLGLAVEVDLGATIAGGDWHGGLLAGLEGLADRRGQRGQVGHQLLPCDLVRRQDLAGLVCVEILGCHFETGRQGSGRATMIMFCTLSVLLFYPV